MDPELTEAEVEALNKLVDEVEKLNKQLQRFVQRSQPEPLFEDQSIQLENPSGVFTPEVAACGLDDPCDVEVKPIDSETSSQHLGVKYSSKSNNLIKSETTVDASCEEVQKCDLVVDEYPKEDHDSLEVNTIVDQSVVVDSVQTQVTFNHLSSEVSLDFVWNKFEVVEWKETQGFAKSVYAPSCYISKCSPTVCQNALVECSSYFIIHMRSISYIPTPILKERSAKPPAKPPDNIYNLHVDDLIALVMILNDTHEEESSLLSFPDLWKHKRGVHKFLQVKVVDGNFVYDKGKGHKYKKNYLKIYEHLVQDIGELKPTVKTALQEEVVSVETQVRATDLWTFYFNICHDEWEICLLYMKLDIISEVITVLIMVLCRFLLNFLGFLSSQFGCSDAVYECILWGFCLGDYIGSFCGVWIMNDALVHFSQDLALREGNFEKFDGTELDEWENAPPEIISVLIVYEGVSTIFEDDVHLSYDKSLLMPSSHFMNLMRLSAVSCFMEKGTIGCLIDSLMSGILTIVSTNIVAPVQHVKFFIYNQAEMIMVGRLSEPYYGITDCSALKVGVVTLSRLDEAVKYEVKFLSEEARMLVMHSRWSLDQTDPKLCLFRKHEGLRSRSAINVVSKEPTLHAGEMEFSVKELSFMILVVLSRNAEAYLRRLIITFLFRANAMKKILMLFEFQGACWRTDFLAGSDAFYATVGAILVKRKAFEFCLRVKPGSCTTPSVGVFKHYLNQSDHIDLKLDAQVAAQAHQLSPYISNTYFIILLNLAVMGMGIRSVSDVLDCLTEKLEFIKYVEEPILEYLSFVKGSVSSEELSLNFSRALLKQDKIYKQVTYMVDVFDEYDTGQLKEYEVNNTLH